MINFSLDVETKSLTVSDQINTKTFLLAEHDIEELTTFLSKCIRSSRSKFELKFQNSTFIYDGGDLTIIIEDIRFVEGNPHRLDMIMKNLLKQLKEINQSNETNEKWVEPKNYTRRTFQPEHRIRINEPFEKRIERRSFKQESDFLSERNDNIRNSFRSRSDKIKLFTSEQELNSDELKKALFTDDLKSFEYGFELNSDFELTKVKVLEKDYISLSDEEFFEEESDILSLLYSRIVILSNNIDDIKEYHKVLLDDKLNPRLVSSQESRVIVKLNCEIYGIDKKIGPIKEVNSNEKGFFLDDDEDENALIIQDVKQQDYKKFKNYRICVPRIEFLKENLFSPESVEDELFRMKNFFKL